jgi:hypothetical protein
MTDENGRATIREVYALIGSLRQEQRDELASLRADIRALDARLSSLSLRVAAIGGAAGAISTLALIAVRFLT